MVPGIVEHLLGPRWAGSTSVMQAIVLATVIGIVSDAAIPLLKGVGRPARVVVLEIIRISTLVLAAWFLTGPLGLLGVGVADVIAAVMCQIVVVFLLLPVLENPLSGLRPTSFAILAAALCGALLSWLMLQIVPNAGGLVLAAIVGGLGAIIMGFILDRAYRMGILITVLEPFPRLASIANRVIRD
jgi:O-antigen/teichoic acid export membrane protein